MAWKAGSVAAAAAALGSAASWHDGGGGGVEGGRSVAGAALRDVGGDRPEAPRGLRWRSLRRHPPGQERHRRFSLDEDPEAVAQVEAAYDMLLMRSLMRRRAGNVETSSIRYADVKPINSPAASVLPKWVQKTMKDACVSIAYPDTNTLGVQAGVYGALMFLTFLNGAPNPTAIYNGSNVPGVILATGFGASLYFLSRKNIGIGKAAIIAIGGLVSGAVVGSAVEGLLLHVDISPLFGIRSPAVIVSEFILFAQLLVSLFLR